MSNERPFLAGGMLVVLAAMAFGATTPLVQLFGRASPPLLTATLLYAGAALTGFAPRGATTEPPVRREHVPRLVVLAITGSIVAPALLAFGLGRTSGSIASLLLNFEAPFTIVLAAVVYREPLGRRVLVAIAIMLAGAVSLVLDGFRGGAVGWASLAIVGATFAWALDNTLTRPFAKLDPTEVVRWKATVGAGLGAVLCLATHASLPRAIDAFGLLACGAIGYGLSLRLYLLGQRRIGAARTGSIFAVAPFVGAGSAWLLGDHSAGIGTSIGAVLFALALWLHLTERHGHLHRHARLRHEHLHRHDDEHHDHVHDPPFVGEHRHPHVHEERVHDHAHGADEHHEHAH